jgi:hypothetical protein
MIQIGKIIKHKSQQELICNNRIWKDLDHKQLKLRIDFKI